MTDTPSNPKMEEKRKLKAKAELLWRLVTTTSGVADLAEPMRRVEHHFDRLTKRQQVTVAMIAHEFDRGCHEIDAQEIAIKDKAQDTSIDPISATVEDSQVPEG